MRDLLDVPGMFSVWAGVSHPTDRADGGDALPATCKLRLGLAAGGGRATGFVDFSNPSSVKNFQIKINNLGVIYVKMMNAPQKFVDMMYAPQIAF